MPVAMGRREWRELLEDSLVHIRLGMEIKWPMSSKLFTVVFTDC